MPKDKHDVRHKVKRKLSRKSPFYTDVTDRASNRYDSRRYKLPYPPVNGVEPLVVVPMAGVAGRREILVYVQAVVLVVIVKT